MQGGGVILVRVLKQGVVNALDLVTGVLEVAANTIDGWDL